MPAPCPRLGREFPAVEASRTSSEYMAFLHCALLCTLMAFEALVSAPASSRAVKFIRSRSRVNRSSLENWTLEQADIFLSIHENDEMNIKQSVLTG